MDQRERADKIDATLAAEPIENADASEPTDPTDKIDPLDPMLRMEPEAGCERDEPAEIRITTFWQAAEQPGRPRSAHHRR